MKEPLWRRAVIALNQL